MTVFSRAARLAALTFASGSLFAGTAYANEAERPADTGTTVATNVTTGVNPAFMTPLRALPPLINVPAAPRVPSPLLSSQRASFASLEDAVAAHHGTGVTGEAERCLAGAIFFESKGEPLSGQLAVAQVVVNRAKSGRFASDVCGVVKQRGQFSFVRGGIIPVVDEGRAAWRTAVAVAKVALAEAWQGVAPKALYFHAKAVGVRAGMTRVASIGNHVFFR